LALVTLTDVLDKYLEDAYDLQKRTDVQGETQHLDVELELSQWEMTLSNDLRRSIIGGSTPQAPGLPNLRLSYLYLKLMARKHAVDRAKAALAADVSVLRMAHLHVRRATEDVVLFVQELNKAALADFWFPLNAFAFSATVALLLRSALEMEQSRDHGFAQSPSVKLAHDLLATLKHHRQESEWDLGDICVAQYSEVVEKLLNPSEATTSDTLDSIGDGLQLDTFSGADLNWPYPDLWELFTNR